MHIWMESSRALKAENIYVIKVVSGGFRKKSEEADVRRGPSSQFTETLRHSESCCGPLVQEMSGRNFT